MVALYPAHSAPEQRSASPSPPSPWVSLFLGTRGTHWRPPGVAAGGSGFRLKGVGWGRWKTPPPCLHTLSAPFSRLPWGPCPCGCDSAPVPRQPAVMAGPGEAAQASQLLLGPRGLPLSHSPPLPPLSLGICTAFIRVGGSEGGEAASSRRLSLQVEMDRAWRKEAPHPSLPT